MRDDVEQIESVINIKRQGDGTWDTSRDEQNQSKCINI